MNLINRLTTLFRVTEAERIQAGIFLGEEDYYSDTERNNFPASTVGEANLRIAQDG